MLNALWLAWVGPLRVNGGVKRARVADARPPRQVKLVEAAGAGERAQAPV